MNKLAGLPGAYDGVSAGTDLEAVERMMGFVTEGDLRAVSVQLLRWEGLYVLRLEMGDASWGTVIPFPEGSEPWQFDLLNFAVAKWSLDVAGGPPDGDWGGLVQ